MALNLTEKPLMKKMIKLSPQLLKGKRFIKINPEDLVRMRNEGRVIIQADKLMKTAMLMGKPSVFPIQLAKPQQLEERLQVPRLVDEENSQTQQIDIQTHTQLMTQTHTQNTTQHLTNGKLPGETDTYTTQSEGEGEAEIEMEGVETDVTRQEELRIQEQPETELDKVKRELEETKRQVREWQERCLAKDREIKEYKKLIELLKDK